MPDTSLSPEDSASRVVCFVRHAETTWNLEGRVQGHRDSALSVLGLHQSRCVARSIAGEHWDALYASGLTRALQTAGAINRLTGLPIRVRPRLNERGQGALEGVLGHEVVAWDQDLDGPALGREPRVEFVDRCRAVMRQILTSTRERRIVVVTHGGVIRACRDSIGVALDEIDQTPESASVSVLSVVSGEFCWSGYNQTEHLGRWRSDMASPTIRQLMTSGGEPT